MRESEALGHGYADTEHLLLGLVREGDGVAAQVLVHLGGDLNRVRQQVILLLHREAGTGPARAQARRGKREHARLIDALARAHPVDQRLAAIEGWVGMTPDLGGLDQEIAHVRRSLAAELSWVSAELERLRDILRRHGLDDAA